MYVYIIANLNKMKKKLPLGFNS